MRASVRPLLVAAFAFVAASAAHAQGTADSLGVHPRIPSTAQSNEDLMYEQGAPAGVAPVRDRAKSLAEGRTLYDTHCSSCHGADLKGTASVPSLESSGGAAVDFYLVTGRMPSANESVPAVHTPPHFDARQIGAIDAYVSSRAQKSTAIPHVVLNRALLQRGRHIFENDCEACHGAAAEGATAGGRWVALPLYRATPTEIGEAVRIGPGVMPRFTPAQLSAEDVDAVATYVNYLTVNPDTYGGFTMGFLGPAAEGLVGGILGVGALFWVIFFTGTKADGTRLHERRR
ncbi:MAG: cytochrome c [Vulcanimicrobiaceae bacterium]